MSCVMTDTSRAPELDRRKFINGRWQSQNDSALVEIASILVQVRPERCEAVAHAIESLPGTQIYSRDPKGKLVVVIEAGSTGVIGTTLNTISLMPHVLTAALVFHGTDAG